MNVRPKLETKSRTALEELQYILYPCKRSHSDTLPWYISMYWLMFNITVTIAVVITLLYWILLFDAEFEQSARALGLDVTTHALNSVFALAELFASRTPVKLVHIYQPLGVGLWYAAFSVIYYIAGGTDSMGNPFIYEVLYWGDGTRAGIVVAAATGGLLVVYVCLWAFARLRNYLSERCIRTTSADLPLAPPLTPTLP
ncbi:Protein rolling stone [Eumeta japonica]|uniref:Protein rolling stone n=1 Tax=Eumeta variegata TaxID=151549 RepID=A0A4C1ZNB4_EUMVA|nr:Protein rolling stone [Eumeta japonica]